MAYGRSYGLPVITTRGNNVYGPNQFPEKLIPKFILLAMQGKNLPIHGDGSNVRSYLYCEDVAEAFEVVLHKGIVGNVYNIGTQKERRVIDVAKDICRLFGLDPEKVIKFVDNRPFNDQRYYLDDTKLKELGWSERTKWEEGLKKTMDWYIKNPAWWGDVSGALLPHPRMLTMAGLERFSEANDVAEVQDEITVETANEVAPGTQVLIYGKDGLINQLLGRICSKQGIQYECGLARLEDRSEVLSDVVKFRPAQVWNASCVGERSGVDWSESHKVEAIRSNVVGALNLADVCRENGVLLVHFSCENSHSECSENGFKDDNSKPSFTETFSFKTRTMVEDLLYNFDNVCTLRVKMPVLTDQNNSCNLSTKIIQSGKGANLPTNMAALEDLLPSLIGNRV
eukprot:TRINITY_DN13882_c0_g3_i1.p1 TRINITY_DN13882_c0_g3~~TRINITY_DN13882_c0_g3_i1.p1  ORF type:complete len:407 (-),score=86.94 TRINITY_DN13882_c0_g3_i1:21-1214(-)